MCRALPTEEEVEQQLTWGSGDAAASSLVGPGWSVRSRPTGARCLRRAVAARDDVSCGGGRVTRVLVVDDEPSILRALRINLSAREYEVSTAVDGTTGLAAVARDRPDVIILDLGLPDMDGTEVIHGVRGWTSIPIIVLSAWGRRARRSPRSTPAPMTM